MSISIYRLRIYSPAWNVRLRTQRDRTRRRGRAGTRAGIVCVSTTTRTNAAISISKRYGSSAARQLLHKRFVPATLRTTHDLPKSSPNVLQRYISGTRLTGCRVGGSRSLKSACSCGQVGRLSLGLVRSCGTCGSVQESLRSCCSPIAGTGPRYARSLRPGRIRKRSCSGAVSTAITSSMALRMRSNQLCSTAHMSARPAAQSAARCGLECRRRLG